MRKRTFLFLILGALASLGVAEAQECRQNGECDRSQYCERPVGQCKTPGKCAVRPQNCTLQHDPVCGCDGKTYGNACLAANQGVNVDHKGECKEAQAGAKGACRSSEECGEGEFCFRRAGHCERPGRCEPRPEACTMIFDPVCGCNGQTYSNACGAYQGGTSVDYQDACR